MTVRDLLEILPLQSGIQLYVSFSRKPRGIVEITREVSRKNVRFGGLSPVHVVFWDQMVWIDEMRREDRLVRVEGRDLHCFSLQEPTEGSAFEPTRSAFAES